MNIDTQFLVVVAIDLNTCMLMFERKKDPDMHNIAAFLLLLK